MSASATQGGHKNGNDDNEQDREAQSALTTAPKETKYRYYNAKQLMKFS